MSDVWIDGLEGWGAAAAPYLMHQVWQVTLLVAVTGLMCRTVFKHQRHLGYVLWGLVLLKCVTPPLWSSPFGVFSWTTHEERLAAVVDRPKYAFEPMPVVERSWSFERERQLTSAPPLKRPIQTPVTVRPVSGRTATQPAKAASSAPSIGWLVWLLGAWLGGAVACGTWLVVRLVTARRVIGRLAEPCRNLELVVLMEGIVRRLGIRRQVALLTVPTGIGPATFGIWRPAIVLPETVAESCSRRELELILGHELLHVRRWDTLHTLFQAFVQSVWWFHPLVWWANRQIVGQRERCCDEELVAGFCPDPAEYADCLMRVLRRRLPQPLPGTLSLGSFATTRARLEMIMSFDTGLNRRTPRRCWIAACLAGLIVLPGAALVTTTVPAADADAPPRERLELTQVYSSEAMESASFAEISPDGRNLYVTAWNDGTITVFDRDHQTGQLTEREVVERPELSGITDFRVSSDGRIAVASSIFAQAVVLFERRPVSGQLNVLDVISGPVEGDAHFPGFTFPVDVALSPDGRFAYIADAAHEGRSGPSDQGAIVVLEITADGRLKPVQRFIGKNRCLDGARAIVSHPDGRTLFATAHVAETLVVLDRNPTDGKLALRQVLSRKGGLDVLHGVMTPAVSPDGQTVYTVSGRFTEDRPVKDLAVRLNLNELTVDKLNVNGVLGTEATLSEDAIDAALEKQATRPIDVGLVVIDDAIAGGAGEEVVATAAAPQGVGVFRLTSDGRLTHVQSVLSGGREGMELKGGNQLLISNDGARVYVSGTNSGTVASFLRDAKTGQLKLEQLVQSGNAEWKSLRGANGLAESADRRFLYVTGEFSGAVTVLTRRLK